MYGKGGLCLKVGKKKRERQGESTSHVLSPCLPKVHLYICPPALVCSILPCMFVNQKDSSLQS